MKKILLITIAFCLEIATSVVMAQKKVLQAAATIQAGFADASSD